MARSRGIGRTGQKQKRARAAAKAGARGKRKAVGLAALEEAVASARVHALVAAGDDGAVSAWLNNVLEQVEVQVRLDNAPRTSASCDGMLRCTGRPSSLVQSP